MKKTLLCWLAALGAAAVIPACGGAAGDKSLSGLDRERFRSEVNGRPTDLYTLTNAAGMEVCITNFGGRIVSVMVPDRTGTLRDVVLGFDNIADYVRIPSDFGASIGRYANRIGHGRFVLDGDTVRLPVNNYGHCLHGGPQGWQYSIYDATQTDDTTLALTLTSPDGDMNFPGTVKANVTYRLLSDNSIDIQYEATTDKPTVINMTNHSYFNLNGDASQPITNCLLYVNADNTTPIDSTFMTTGEIVKVEGTPFDFRKPVVLDSVVNNFDNVQIKNGKGIDHNWCLNTYKDGQGDDKTIAASVYCPTTGIKLDVYTNEPGIQVYTGNFLDGTVTGKYGKQYNKHAAICLETQHYPDTPNKPQWPTALLKPGETYKSHCIFKFSVYDDAALEGAAQADSTAAE